MKTGPSNQAHRRSPPEGGATTPQLNKNQPNRASPKVYVVRNQHKQQLYYIYYLLSPAHDYPLLQLLLASQRAWCLRAAGQLGRDGHMGDDIVRGRLGRLGRLALLPHRVARLAKDHADGRVELPEHDGNPDARDALAQELLLRDRGEGGVVDHAGDSEGREAVVEDVGDDVPKLLLERRLLRALLGHGEHHAPVPEHLMVDGAFDGGRGVGCGSMVFF